MSDDVHTAGSSDPAVWLKRELDRTETRARSATQGPWSIRPNDSDDEFEIVVSGPRADGRGELTRWVVGANRSGGGVYDKDDAEHIVLWSPSTTLRMIEGSREILAEHDRYDRPRAGLVISSPVVPVCPTCWGFVYPCHTVTTLAKMWGWTGE